VDLVERQGRGVKLATTVLALKVALPMPNSIKLSQALIDNNIGKNGVGFSA
jgi:hypothetical protein